MSQSVNGPRASASSAVTKSFRSQHILPKAFHDSENMTNELEGGLDWFHDSEEGSEWGK